MSSSIAAPSTDCTHIVSRVPRYLASKAIQYQRRRRVFESLLAVGTPVLLLIIWQIAAGQGWVDARLYPAPTTLADAAWSLATDGRLWRDVLDTTQRIILGYAWGAGLGLAVGSVMGMSRLVRRALEPILTGLYVVPKLALLPIFLTIFGYGEAPKIVLVAVTVFFFVWIETMEAIVAVPDGYREAGESLGVSRAQMFLHVYLPGALPSIFVGLRIAMGVAVLVIIAAEFIVGETGLGNLIFTSRQLFINTWVYTGIVVVAIEGVILAWIVAQIGRALTPWVVRHGHGPR
jgi:sulfonate transport system permease protein